MLPFLFDWAIHIVVMLYIYMYVCVVQCVHMHSAYVCMVYMHVLCVFMYCLHLLKKFSHACRTSVKTSFSEFVGDGSMKHLSSNLTHLLGLTADSIVAQNGGLRHLLTYSSGQTANKQVRDSVGFFGGTA